MTNTKYISIRTEVLNMVDLDLKEKLVYSALDGFQRFAAPFQGTIEWVLQYFQLTHTLTLRELAVALNGLSRKGYIEPQKIGEINGESIWLFKITTDSQ